MSLPVHVSASLTDYRLVQHEQQLAMVEEALAIEPDREDLLELKKELENIISLLREYMTANPAAQAETQPDISSGEEPNPPPSRHFNVGQAVMARYASDGLFYPARVTRINGALYTVLFDGYGNTEQVSEVDLRNPTAHTASSSTPAPSTTPVVGEIVRPSKEKEAQAEAERRKRRSEKKRERFESKKIEAEKKQSSWQKFATKGAKKGYAISGAKGKSMFRTPDDPNAKVGVVGAGRGMTSNAGRHKHTQTLG